MTVQLMGSGTPLFVFDLVREAARLKARCPTNDQISAKLMRQRLRSVHPSGRGWTGELAKAGYFRIEVSGHNWRTIEILVGPDKGARTMDDPKGGTIYRRIDNHGDKWLTRG